MNKIESISVSEWLTTLYFDILKQNSDFQIAFNTFDKEDVNKENPHPGTRHSCSAELQNNNRNRLDIIAHRQILPNEIILDCDGSIEEFDSIISKLKEEKYFFYSYKTKNNRSKRISIFSGGLINEPPHKRQSYRKNFIKKFNCDCYDKNYYHTHTVPPVACCNSYCTKME